MNYCRSGNQGRSLKIFFVSYFIPLEAPNETYFNYLPIKFPFMCTSMGKILKGTVLYGPLQSVLNVAWSQIEKKKQLA